MGNASNSLEEFLDNKLDNVKKNYRNLIGRPYICYFNGESFDYFVDAFSEKILSWIEEYGRQTDTT